MWPAGPAKTFTLPAPHMLPSRSARPKLPSPLAIEPMASAVETGVGSEAGHK